MSYVFTPLSCIGKLLDFIVSPGVGRHDVLICNDVINIFLCFEIVLVPQFQY